MTKYYKAAQTLITNQIRILKKSTVEPYHVRLTST